MISNGYSRSEIIEKTDVIINWLDLELNYLVLGYYRCLQWN